MFSRKRVVFRRPDHCHMIAVIAPGCGGNLARLRCDDRSRSRLRFEDLLPDSAPAEPVIGEDDGDHGFSHGDEARQQAGIVAALCADRGWQAIASHGGLFFGETAGRLDGGSQNNRHAGTDASEHSAVAI